jgi:hypothetical protein
MKRLSRYTGRPLEIARPRSARALRSADISQSPDYTVTSTTDGSGPVLTNVEVAAVFWGSYWSTSPAPSPSSDTYYQAFTGLVTGPYMTGLRQYRGVGPGIMLGKFINDSSDPANGYSDSDVVNMLTSFFQNNANVPAPETGHQRFYAVVTPPGINNGNTGAIGEHKSFSYNGAAAYYCWVDSAGGLTDNSSDGVVNIFSHELVEACTDPLGSAIHVNGTGVSNDEIGDTCNNEFAIVEMNGVNCNVQCYWSAADNACIIPLGSLSFLIDKNTFGKDEVNEAIKASNGVFSSAFWLALDGFSIDTFNSFTVAIPTPTGSFANVPGVTINPTPAVPGQPPPAQPIPVYEDPADSSVIQRIRFSFDVSFTSPLSTPFPSSGAIEYALTATFTTTGKTVPGANSQETVNFELVSGADPYFSNIDPANANAVSWLSRDLRVFSLTKGKSALPGDPAAPTFGAGQTPYGYIQALIGYLNSATAYTVPQTGSADPLNGLPGQTGYETGDSSVTPLDGSGHQNYNFALARVRLSTDAQGLAGEASNVRVFFRLWVAPSCDTDFQPYATYPSTPGYPALPASPLPSSAGLPPDPSGQAIQTTPFFATGKTGASDYDPTVLNNNIRPIQVPVVTGQDGVWAYYGCFLDVYDAQNNCSYPGTHHCLVAQIAYDGAPLLYTSGVATNPGNTDKLAQRNLQVTLSGNPGPAATHRIPQAFDTRPSLPFLDENGHVLNQPDELMIDWGGTPAGANARIYWPDVQSSDVLALAARLYGTHLLRAADAHTIAFKAVKGVTYVPIPPGTADTYAGLLTIDLPLGIRAGREYNVVVRRISTTLAPPVIEKPAARAATAQADAAPDVAPQWRYITGAFQVKIPVTTEEHMLGPEENTLAILKARLAAMSPAYRWHPVVQRYIEYVAARVDGAGGNAASVPPSLNGAPAEHGTGHHPRPGEGRHTDHHEDEQERTGKVSALVFDHFGDFDGFVLETAEGEVQFRSRERDMRDLAQRAWRERLRITVWSDDDEPHRLLSVELRDPPAPFAS